MKSGADLRPPLRQPSGNSESVTGAYFLGLVSNVIIGYLTLLPLVMLAPVLENAFSFSPGWTGDSFGWSRHSCWATYSFIAERRSRA